MLPARLKTPLLPLLGLLLTLAPSPAAEDSGQASPWTALFDGRTLQGWRQRGGRAEYRVEDGVIVGRSIPNTPNSFLCTERDYTNFVLELEFKVDPGLNSGVQIRSQCFDNPTTFTWDGRDFRVPAGRVHGLQVEIDPSARAWSAGVHEEAGRGWIDKLKDNEAARKAFRAGDWNQLHIECQGDSIKTWINQVPAAKFQDRRVAAGFIALQVHGVGQKQNAMEVRFRNVRIRER